MDQSFLHEDSEDADQTGRMPRLVCVFAGRTWHFVGFLMRWLICPEDSVEPSHDKTNKMASAPNENSDHLGHPPSLV